MYVSCVSCCFFFRHSVLSLVVLFLALIIASWTISKSLFISVLHNCECLWTNYYTHRTFSAENVKSLIQTIKHLRNMEWNCTLCFFLCGDYAKKVVLRFLRRHDQSSTRSTFSAKKFFYIFCHKTWPNIVTGRKLSKIKKQKRPSIMWSEN